MLPPSLLLLLLPSLCFSQPEFVSHPTRTSSGFHLPLYKHDVSRLERRSGSATGATGLGDFHDITYSVRVDVGGTQIQLALDTGSSDLWVASTACKLSLCTNNITLYPQTTFQSANVDARLFYGDSTTGTHAFGEIGKDLVGVAGIAIQNQFFAAINDTNTTVLQTGSAGILGLGFPVNSVIWSRLFSNQFLKKRLDPRTPNTNPWHSRRQTTETAAARDIPAALDLRRTRFPDLTSLLYGPTHPSPRKRQIPAPSSSLTSILNSFATFGPLVSRLAQSALPAPQFTITLQRDSVAISSGGNGGAGAGMLSLGGLPGGVANSSLTWVPIRGYTAAQGGLDSPTEQYPIAWEVPVDDVFVDGQRLPRSTLSPGFAVTALIDTGSSLIRGPRDVVGALMNAVLGPGKTTFDCGVPHTLAFQIGGAMFPVNPLDFLAPAPGGHAKACVPNVVATDPPRNGFLYSWSLGDPFLKSNLASFYFGNLTHPSTDPPRVGFMSTVESAASDELRSAVSAAQSNGGVFSATMQDAPTSNMPIFTTVTGVPPDVPTDVPAPLPSGRKSSGARAGVVVAARAPSFSFSLPPLLVVACVSAVVSVHVVWLG